MDGQLCIDTGDTTTDFVTYSGSVVTRASPAVVEIWLGSDAAGGDVVGAFDDVGLVQTGLELCPVYY